MTIPPFQPLQAEPDSARPSWHQQWAFTRKELRETLRDRRTIITLLAMPLLLYPLLGLGVRYLALQQIAAESPEYRIALQGELEAQWFREVLRRGEFPLERDPFQREAYPQSTRHHPPPAVQILVPTEAGVINLQMFVSRGDADLGVMVDFRDSSLADDLPGAHVELIRRNGSLAGLEAADFVVSRLERVRERQLRDWTQASGLQFALPVTQHTLAIEPERETNALLGLLPLVLLLMTVTGGVYPAIDLTAGERERDTLETLMALPVPRYRLLLAKFVAVVTVTLLTGLMNLLAMSITMYAMQLETLLFGAEGLTAWLVFKLCLVLACFATFYATVLLLITCSARSFKEAQAYLIPLLLVSFSPGLVMLQPGWNLNYLTATLPLLNMLLLAREFLEGTAPLLPAMATGISSGLYAACSLLLAARLFGSDAAGTGSPGGWRDLFARPRATRPLPSFSLASLLLVVTFPLYFIASGLLARVEVSSMGLRLILSGLLTLLLFGLFPLFWLGWQRISFRAALSLNWPRLRAWPGALLLGLWTWPWVFEMVVWLNEFQQAGIATEQFAQVEELLIAWRSVPFPLVLLVLAGLPAVCEELFFRGVLRNGLKEHLGPGFSVVFAALAFGLFHVVVAGGAAPVRVVPSTCLGLILGWVAWQSGSILPAMLLHALHNATLLSIARYQQELSGWQLGDLETTHLPAGWLVVSAVCMLLGLLLVRSTQRNPNPGHLPIKELAPMR